jgi:hypothetical protein
MTPSQLEAARETVAAAVTTSLDDGEHEELRDALRILLAATAPPSEEELALEAARLWPDDNSRQAKRVAARESRRAAYIAGARREGAR